ncbi:MAG: DUF4198 domain-containing protein, partial [candidate division WOR-3 bacterium]|nr:DUF4198 domain-containing protein [candidate division WOR-3 bacterium]
MKDIARRRRQLVFMSVTLVALIVLPSVSAGHTMWINVSDFSPDFHPGYRARTKVFFGWGHHYPVDDFLAEEQLEEFYFICPRCGKHHRLNPNPGGFLATEVNFKKPGAYIVTAVLKSGFYTMYVEKGEMHHKMGPKKGVKGKVILSLYYEQYAKTLINVGAEDTSAYNKPVGHKIEIVPLKNPMVLSEGDFLPIQVLFNGKPAKYCEVFATYSGFSTGEDFAYATSTDSKGIAMIRILHYGPWLIKADMKLPATEELRDKCNEL